LIDLTDWESDRYNEIRMARKFKFVTNEIYHIFNRGTGKSDVLLDEKDYFRWESLLHHSTRYNYPHSLLLKRIQQARQSGNDPLEVIDAIAALHSISPPPVEIIARTCLPNHYHLALKQITDNGIPTFMHRLGTAFSNYFNLKYDRSGTLWEGPFQAVHVEDEKQFLQLVRYIHVNALAAGLVTKEGLDKYVWSSLPGYLGLADDSICTNKAFLLSFFKDTASFREFTFAPFSQDEVTQLEHITLDDDFEWFAELETAKKEQRRESIVELLN